VKSYTVNNWGGCGRLFLFIKPFSIPLDRKAQGRHEERVAPTLPPSGRNARRSVNVKQLTPWFMDHVLRYTKQKPRNKSLLTAKGRKAKAQGAMIQGI
jgi:hypothetical protein